MRTALLVVLATVAVAAVAAPLVDPMRGPTPIDRTTQPPRLGNWINDDNRHKRGWQTQPPVIPHRVDGYQIDRNFNKCLDCHAREKTWFSQATTLSATHYVSRDGKVLDRISTRRYFCMQCHVAQEARPPLVGNEFRDADAVTAPAGR